MDMKIFEKEKNLKAFGYTTIVCGAIVALFMFVSWMPTSTAEPQFNEGIEINLGDGDEGSGNEMIGMIGAPTNEEVIDPNNLPPESIRSNAEEVTNKPVADNDERDATPIHTPNKPAKKPDPKKTHTVTAPKKTPPKTAVAHQSVPKPAPKAKAIFKGPSAGTGGNNADSYTKGVMSQGNTGNAGVQGRANGTANLGRYDGNGGTGTSGTGTGYGRGAGGVSIRSGLKNRNIVRLPNFEDDFNEPAKVAVDLIVDENGVVEDVTFNPRGTTTVNPTIRNIALNRAKQLKFSKGDSKSSGTIILDFKLRD